MKEKRTVEVYTCDAPDCRNQYYRESKHDEPPEGFHGNVMHVYGGGGAGAEWYACKEEHIQEAILTALANKHT